MPSAQRGLKSAAEKRRATLTPVIRAATDNPRPEPAKCGTRRRDMWLTGDFPGAVWRHELVSFLASQLAAHAPSSMGKIVRPEVFLEVLRRIATLTPPSVRTLAAAPPAAPDPMMQTS